jgi:hypothetical protein
MLALCYARAFQIMIVHKTAKRAIGWVAHLWRSSNSFVKL